MKLKKVLVCALALGLLSGCGGDKEAKKEETKAPVSTEESVEKEEAKEEPESKEEPEEETEEVAKEIQDDVLDTSDPKNIGKTFKNEGMEFKVLKTGYVENEFTTGPIKVKIGGVSIGEMTITDETALAFLGEDYENKPTIVIDAVVENTEDKKMNFYIDQSSITTNTKEQVESNLLLSGGEGEFLGNVEKEIPIFFNPETDINEINEIKMYIDKPNDENFSSVGEDLVITIKFNDKGEVESIS